MLFSANDKYQYENGSVQGKASSRHTFGNDFANDGSLDKDPNPNKIVIAYKLAPIDIMRLILRIHFVLMILPLAFMSGYVLLEVFDRFHSWEAFITFLLFVLSTLCITYFYLSQYLIFKRLYSFSAQRQNYRIEFSSETIRICQNENDNSTQYCWQDFIRCIEKPKVYYFYFKYDRALIVKKQLFCEGNAEKLNDLISENIGKFKRCKK